MRSTTLLVGLLLAATAAAQESPNYQLSDYALDFGGAPALDSPEFRVTLATVGPGAHSETLHAPGFSLDPGFVATYAPPGEVGTLLFDDEETLTWTAERSVGTYNLYRGGLPFLSPPDYGSCLQQQIPQPTTIDIDTPAEGATFFYLVTASNRLDEEGTKGQNSQGSPRPNPSPCP